MKNHIFRNEEWPRVQQEDEEPISDDEISKELAVIWNEFPQAPNACLNRVARLFRRAGHKCVPIDSRTILHTRTEPVGNVDFVHLGLIKGLELNVNKGMALGEVIFLIKYKKK